MLKTFNRMKKRIGFLIYQFVLPALQVSRSDRVATVRNGASFRFSVPLGLPPLRFCAAEVAISLLPCCWGCHFFASVLLGLPFICFCAVGIPILGLLLSYYFFFPCKGLPLPCFPVGSYCQCCQVGCSAAILVHVVCIVYNIGYILESCYQVYGLEKVF